MRGNEIPRWWFLPPILLLALVFLSAQTGTAFGKKITVEQTNKKKRHHATVVLATGISSELPSVIAGNIFDGAPNLQLSLTVKSDIGLYVSFGQWKGLNHVDPNATMGDWVLGTIGYTHKFSRVSMTVEGAYTNPAPLSRICGDSVILRGTIAYPLGKDGRQGILLGTVREVPKFYRGYVDSGTYGYLGYNRDVKVPVVRLPLLVSSEVKIDPGNLGRGAAVVLAERVEVSLLPKRSHWSLRPFVGLLDPLFFGHHVRGDNRSFEFMGGVSLSRAFRI